MTFCQQFILAFEEAKPLGRDISISNPIQMTTSDLDFRIECPVAEYMELAEANPRSEAFGREALRTGKFNVCDYARWIYMRLIRKKYIKYGDQLSKKTILLIYITHWQFLPSMRIFECIRMIIAQQGCKFQAVFFLHTNGSDLRFLDVIHPFPVSIRRKPAEYKGFWMQNLPPGQSSWKVDMTEVPSSYRE